MATFHDDTPKSTGDVKPIRKRGFLQVARETLKPSALTLPQTLVVAVSATDLQRRLSHLSAAELYAAGDEFARLIIAEHPKSELLLQWFTYQLIEGSRKSPARPIPSIVEPLTELLRNFLPETFTGSREIMILHILHYLTYAPTDREFVRRQLRPLVQQILLKTRTTALRAACYEFLDPSTTHRHRKLWNLFKLGSNTLDEEDLELLMDAKLNDVEIEPEELLSICNTVGDLVAAFGLLGYDASRIRELTETFAEMLAEDDTFLPLIVGWFGYHHHSLEKTTDGIDIEPILFRLLHRYLLAPTTETIENNLDVIFHYLVGVVGLTSPPVHNLIRSFLEKARTPFLKFICREYLSILNAA